MTEHPSLISFRLRVFSLNLPHVCYVVLFVNRGPGSGRPRIEFNVWSDHGWMGWHLAVWKKEPYPDERPQAAPAEAVELD